jgi:O-antigen ligase
MYVAPTQHETLLGDYPFPRPVGMIGNPNEVGFAFVLGALASSYRLIKGGGWMYLVATLCNLVALGLTLSRTSLVALVAGVGYLYAIQVFLRDQRGLGERLKYFAFPTSVLVAVIGYVLANPILYDVIGWRFYTLLEFQSTSSWQVRLQSWQKNIRLFMDSPIFGVGPLRRAEVTAGAADNEWLLLLRTYGIVGTIALIGGVVWPNMRAKPGLRRVFVSSLLLGTAVYMIPAAVFHSLSLMPLLLILIAVEDPTTRPLTIP